MEAEPGLVTIHEFGVEEHLTVALVNVTGQFSSVGNTGKLQSRIDAPGRAL